MNIWEKIKANSGLIAALIGLIAALATIYVTAIQIYEFRENLLNRLKNVENYHVEYKQEISLHEARIEALEKQIEDQKKLLSESSLYKKDSTDLKPVISKPETSLKKQNQDTEIPKAQAPVEPDKNWKVNFDERIEGEGCGEKFEMTFDSIEKKENTLIVNIGFRNISEKVEPIRVKRDYKESTVLSDDIGGMSYPIKKAYMDNAQDKTISSPLNVSKGQKKVAHFIFPFPSGVKNARFVSRWEYSSAAYSIEISKQFEIPSK